MSKENSRVDRSIVQNIFPVLYSYCLIGGKLIFQVFRAEKTNLENGIANSGHCQAAEISKRCLPEWEHCAIHELLGKRERYRIINIQRLLQCLDIGSEKAFRTWYLKTIKEKLTCISHNREGYWSEAIAVGGPDWLESAAREAGIKRYAVQNDKKAYIYFMTGKIDLMAIYISLK